MAPNEVSDARTPAQVTAQVAPTPSGSSTPRPDSHSQPQSAPHNTSHSAMTEPFLSPAMTDSISEPKWDQGSDSPAVNGDSLESTGRQIKAGGPLTSPTQSDPDMAPQPQVTPPQVAQVATPGSSQETITAPPTPSTTAPSSDRVLSRLEMFESRSKGAIEKHHGRSHSYLKTRPSFYLQRARMLVLASRGFERGPLPTRQTKPRLLKRRHSVDVNTTENWEAETGASWLHCVPKEFPPVRSHETEVPWISALRFHIPDPRRYAAFGPVWFTEPQYNNEIFLELGDVTIQNDAFNLISATSFRQHGIEVWMRGESLDMALEVLRRDEDCDAHGIGIVNSTVAQICNFARLDPEGSFGEYEQYKALYQNKNWIFVVCNDAMGGLENNGTSGSHWSVVAMDRISKRAYYFDSLYANIVDYQDLGRNISLGMLRILDEDISQWSYRVQWASPNQNVHNLFDHDGGACGPFVFKMTEILIKHIKDYQAQGIENLCDLDIDGSFATNVFKPHFHSGQVREEIKSRIRRWYYTTQASALVQEHDQSAIHGTDVVLDDGPVVNFEVPPKPRLPVLCRTHHTGRDCSTGVNYHDPFNVDDCNENYVTHDNSSDSWHSTAGSSGSDTIVVGQEDLWAEAGFDNNMDDDVNLYDDVDGGVAIINASDGIQDEDLHAMYQSVVNSLPTPNDEEEEVTDIKLD